MNLRHLLGDNRLLIAGGLLFSAILLGGGGSSAPASELALQLIAGMALAAWFLFARSPHAILADGATRKALVVLSACVLALPLVQLIPLPPAIWQSLPGREGQLASLALVGQQDSWRPLSISPSRTFASILSIIPSLVMLFMGASLSACRKTALAGLLLLAILLSVGVGAVQLASAGKALDFYASTHAGFLTGFQANRNSQVDLLLCGLVLAAFLVGSSVPVQGKRMQDGGAAHRLGALGGLSAMLLVAVVLTGSRMGIALLPLAVIGQWLVLRASAGASGRVAMAGRIMPAMSLALVALLGALAFLGKSKVLGTVANRFDVSGDFRTELWKDGWFAMAGYWPFGSGTGTVIPALIGAERLEVVDQTMPNRVHNDFLEWMLESGLPGLLALAAIGILIVFMARRNWKLDKQARPMVLTGLAMFALIALHSVVDYPLRSMSLAVVAAFAVALICPSPRGSLAMEKD